MTHQPPVLPGHRIGIVGGGQLGRMLSLVASEIGYDVAVLDPDPESPAGRVADEHLCAPYDDESALTWLKTHCQAVTTEFENVPADVLEQLSSQCIVSPSAAAVSIAQDRIQEKTFLQRHGLQTAPFSAISQPSQIAAAWHALGGGEAILKTARMGYDGKGQSLCGTQDEVDQAFRAMGEVPCVLEERVAIETEVSIVLARSQDGQVACYSAAENVHTRGILDYTIVPARINPSMADKAQVLAVKLAHAMDYVGVLAVEFFITKTGDVLINEIAPRPHNSGHFTQDAADTCQFEQQLRALCQLPLGSTQLRSAAVMVNLMGDLWGVSGEPDWLVILRDEQAKLHLYGKKVPKAGRKMGHFTYLAEDVEIALDKALALKQALSEHSGR